MASIRCCDIIWGIVKPYIPSALITLACIIGFFLPMHAFTTEISVANSLLFHFSHANIFHLIINLICLWQFHPRWATTAVAFLVATIASLIPFVALVLPTCGLSAFIFAAYARKFVSWHMPVWRILGLQLVFILIPNVNWRIHVMAFGISYIVWYVYYNRRHITRK